jgi:hypothetical protein
VWVFPGVLDAAGEVRDRLMRALLVNTSWAAWSLLRDELGLDVEHATGAMIRAVDALLTAGSASGSATGSAPGLGPGSASDQT